MAAKGSCVVVSANPQGKFVEGTLKAGITPKPGTALQIDADASQLQGRDVWELFDASTYDGAQPIGPVIILRENYLLGKTMDDAYAAEDRAFGYIPEPGDELNLRLADAAGTVDIAYGTGLIIDDGTGLFVETTGSPEYLAALTRSAYEGDTGEQMTHCVWSGN